MVCPPFYPFYPFYDLLIPSLRMIERLFIVGFGGLSIYLGYRLFFQFPYIDDQHGEFEFPGIKVVMSKVGPGVFFLVIVAYILIQSLAQGIKVETGQQATIQNQVVQATSESKKFAGMVPVQGQSEGLPQRRVAVIEKLGALNCVLFKLQAKGVDLSESESLAFLGAKIGLLKPVWNETAWGEFDVFVNNLDDIQNQALRGVFHDVSISCS